MLRRNWFFFFFFLGTEPFCSILIFDGEISGNSDSDEKKLWPYLTTLNGPLRSAVIPVPEIDTSVACQSSYTKVFASGSSFQDVCGEFIGLSQNRPVQRPSLSLTFNGGRFGCPWLFKKWKSRGKNQNQQNIHCSRRPTARSRQKARPISIEFVRSFAMHCRWNNGLSRSKIKNKRLAL